MSDLFFPSRPNASPTIYAFASTHPDHADLLKVGATERVAADRIAEQCSGPLLKRLGIVCELGDRKEAA